MSKQRVVVIFGGRSGEHEVSLMSARSVLSALDQTRYQVLQVGITHAGAWLTSADGSEVLSAFEQGKLDNLLSACILPDPTRQGLFILEGNSLRLLSAIDVVFPVLHGTYGEDGTLQGLLEMACLPYVGAGVLGSAVGMDKGLFKKVMAAAGLPVLESVIVLRSELQSDSAAALAQAEQVAGYPLFVKPANLGSSIGITKCQSRSDLYEGLMEASHFDRRILVERGIPAREIEISVLGNSHPEASVAGEVLPSREFYSYESKYLDNTSGLLIPAPLSEAQQQQAREIAIRAYQLADCAGMARVDFLLDKSSGQLYLNEINTIPGFTQISMYPKLWEASGLPYPALIDRLIELALERRAERDHTVWSYDASHSLGGGASGGKEAML